MVHSADEKLPPAGVEQPAAPLRLTAAAARVLEGLSAKPLAPALYVVATPIGNLADITLRALHVLSAAEIIYCEDTRTSSRLLSHYGIEARTRPLHDHNEAAETERIVRLVQDGRRVALISDAGTPLVSDPGFKVVRACAEAGLAVISIPGASAVLAALCSSGLPTHQFTFAGFLPPKPAARRARLEELKATEGTLVFFEAPQRLAASLADMAEQLGSRVALVARELTKLHEELARGDLPGLAAQFARREVKGEVVVLIGPDVRGPASDDDVLTALEVALQSMRIKEASAFVASSLGIAKTRAYALALKIKGQSGQ